MIQNTDQIWGIIYPFIYDNEIDKTVSYCNNLTNEELEKVEDRLIHELNHTNENNMRNTISIILGDLKCNKSIDTMIKILNNKKNKNCATLIYALEELDCSDRIVEIFHIIFDGNYEAKHNLFRLLEDKIGEMKEGDKEKCLKYLNKKIEKVESELAFLYNTAEEIFKVSYEE